MRVTNESLQLGMWNLVQIHTMNTLQILEETIFCAKNYEHGDGMKL